MKHLLLVYVSQNNCFYYLSNTNTPNTVFYYLLFQIVSEILFVFPNSPLVAKEHYLYLSSQIVKYQIAALVFALFARARLFSITCPLSPCPVPDRASERSERAREGTRKKKRGKKCGREKLLNRTG